MSKAFMKSIYTTSSDPPSSIISKLVKLIVQVCITNTSDLGLASRNPALET